MESDASAPKLWLQKVGSRTWIQVDDNYPLPADPKNRIPADQSPPSSDDWLDKAIREVIEPPHVPTTLLFLLTEALWFLSHKIKGGGIYRQVARAV
jgi:hypothetical protein